MIEVKRPTPDGGLVFSDDSATQAREYAEALSAGYYAVTDGRYLRLFRVADASLVGNYLMSLEEGQLERLLRGLSDLHLGRSDRLPLEETEDPLQRFSREGGSLLNELVELFREISTEEEGVEVRRVKGEKSWLLYLDIGTLRGVLRLGLGEEPGVEIWLDELRKALTENELEQVIRDLSEIRGFNLA